jgi:hypothetical protein
MLPLCWRPQTSPSERLRGRPGHESEVLRFMCSVFNLFLNRSVGVLSLPRRDQRFFLFGIIC